MSCLAIILAVVAGRAYAEDIDLFVGSPPTSGNLPNVLIIFDNTANWNQPFANEKSALRTLFQNRPVNPDNSAKLNIGLMMFTETGNPNNNTDGGYVRAALRPMTPANKTIYAELINRLDQGADVSNGGKAGLTMAEAYRYLSAGVPRSGNNKVKTDFTGNTGSNWPNPSFTAASKTASQAVYALPGNALTSVGGTQYQVPGSGGCRKNYIIYISNSAAQDNNSDITTGEGMLTAAGGSTARINISPSGSAENPSDEWARFMKQSPLDVTTYTIDVNRVTTGQGPGWSALLKSMAGVSQGKYFSVTVDASVGASEFANALNQALAEILAVNTVFASVSLPVSVNTQGTYLNQVFIGMFRPDAAAAPRWNGNLKQYRLGASGTEIQLQDANGNSAINGQTGFIGECARSYWTPTTRDTYWTFKPQGLCPIPADQTDPNYYAASNSPDGSVVEKGGQAYVLRSSTARNIKTCSKTFASCTALTDFAVANTDIDHVTLGVGTSQRDDLVRWARGQDVLDEDIDGVTTAEMRPSVHGDVVHSRPVAINLGTDAAPKVTVFYGGNDGVFRAVNGNRVTTVNSATQGNVAPGGEYWSFVPPESFPILKRLQANAPMIKFPNVTDASARVKDYGMDGAITAHQFSTGAWIYSTMRRGGRVLYSFNVNNTDPGNVTLKWKVGCPKNLVAGSAADDSGCTTGFEGIGQTWSAPKVMITENAPTTQLLIMGGGHDLCEDADPNTCSSTSKGRKVYVMNANTGALLQTFDTDRPVVAEVALAPDLTTNFVKYAYVVDMGGNVYRITIGSAAAGSWTMTKVAALGCATPSTCSGNRKFQFAADVVAEGDGYALLVGSGDREKPLRYSSPSVVNSVANYFFKIQDKPLDATWLTNETTICGGSNPFLCLASLQPITGATAPTAEQLAGKKGWYLALGSSEQVVTTAITIFGTVTFSTYEPNTPDANTCSNELGIARVYNVDLNNATSLNGTNSRFEVLPPVGLPPSPVAGKVRLDNDPNSEPAGTGDEVAFCIGCSGRSPLEAEEPPVPVLGLPTIPKSRVYWYIEK
jgi:type IV pilus assembly protein PilY1